MSSTFGQLAQLDRPPIDDAPPLAKPRQGRDPAEGAAGLGIGIHQMYPAKAALAQDDGALHACGTRADHQHVAVRILRPRRDECAFCVQPRWPACGAQGIHWRRCTRGSRHNGLLRLGRKGSAIRAAPHPIKSHAQNVLHHLIRVCQTTHALGFDVIHGSSEKRWFSATNRDVPASVIISPAYRSCPRDRRHPLL